MTIARRTLFGFVAIMMMASIVQAQTFGSRAGAGVTATDGAWIKKAFGNLPLSFEANRGQTDSRVRFLSHGNGYTLFLTPAEAVLTMNRPADTNRKTGGKDPFQ